MGRCLMAKGMNREALAAANCDWLSKMLFRSVARGLGVVRKRIRILFRGYDLP